MLMVQFVNYNLCPPEQALLKVLQKKHHAVWSRWTPTLLDALKVAS